MWERLLAIAGVVIVLGASVGVLVKFTSWSARIVSRVQDFLDDWNGEPARPGVLRRPGVPERLTGIEGRLSSVERQLKPNDGATLRDAVDRIEQHTTSGPEVT